MKALARGGDEKSKPNLRPFSDASPFGSAYEPLDRSPEARLGSRCLAYARAVVTGSRPPEPAGGSEMYDAATVDGGAVALARESGFSSDERIGN